MYNKYFHIRMNCLKSQELLDLINGEFKFQIYFASTRDLKTWIGT